MDVEKLLKTLPILQAQVEALLEFDVCLSIIGIVVLKVFVLVQYKRINKRCYQRGVYVTV